MSFFQTKIYCTLLFLIISPENLVFAQKIVINLSQNDSLQYLPRFWINTGLCPMGKIKNSAISVYLLSPEMKTNIELVGALPNQALRKIRIHWLLQLVDFIEFQPRPMTLWNFTKLDTFLEWVDDAQLVVGFELMGNPGKVFSRHEVLQAYLWEDLAKEIADRYIKRFGIDKILEWEFETWNEPDLKNYNILNFTVHDYIRYVKAIRRGLDAAAAERESEDIHIKLSGPAGLFKSKERHTLCWNVLSELCNGLDMKICPFDTITFHRKGNGNIKDIISGEKNLLNEIFNEFSNLHDMKFSNNEADPIAGWSTPRDFQSDVRYATMVVENVLEHWHLFLTDQRFQNFQSISHDNAFLSYHPYEFSQRTLFARFQMNLTNPPHTQFIQKPVYAALGMLANLGSYAGDIEFATTSMNIPYLVSVGQLAKPFYCAVLAFTKNTNDALIKTDLTNFEINYGLSFKSDEYFSYIVEFLETDMTDPVKVWKFYNSPAYPNASVRHEMRQAQGPFLLQVETFTWTETGFNINVSLRKPWILLIRICSSKTGIPLKAENLRIRRVYKNEVLILWNEKLMLERCIQTYEIWFKSKLKKQKWKNISRHEHVPLLSYHFQPGNGDVLGYYKVRAVDIFGRNGLFSKAAPFLY